MKNNKYFRNIALTVVLAIALAVCALVKTFAPMVILPKLYDVPNMMLLSLAALLLDYYVAKGEKSFCVCLPIGAVLSFGILPLAAGFAGVADAVKLAVMGGAVFTVAALVFASVEDRISTGPAAKAAPILSALGLYLAAQCFKGFF